MNSFENVNKLLTWPTSKVTQQILASVSPKSLVNAEVALCANLAQLEHRKYPKGDDQRCDVAIKSLAAF